jgi:uncharacterized membrane protein YkvA (DUF1232 family)
MITNPHDPKRLEGLRSAGETSGARRRVDAGFVAYLKRTLSHIPFANAAVSLFRYVQVSPDSAVHKAIAVGALLYFITPGDALPDMLPVVGFLDDAGLIALAVSFYGKRVARYRGQAAAWLRGENPDLTPLDDEETPR